MAMGLYIFLMVLVNGFNISLIFNFFWHLGVFGVVTY